MSIAGVRDSFFSNDLINISSTPFISSIDISGNSLVIQKSNGEMLSTPLDVSKLDPYLSFNVDTERVVSSHALETSLQSIYLRSQHKISSGFENVFFTNLTSDIRFFPCWCGIRDQRVEANRGADGILPPSGRVYSDAFELEQLGAPMSGVTVNYDDTTTYDISLSVFGQEFIAGEDIDDTVRLYYQVFSKEGVEVYEQFFDETFIKGERVILYQNHPLEGHAGQTARACIKKIRKSDNADLGFLQVERATNLNADGLIKPYVRIYLRTFEDKELAFKHDLVDVSGATYQELEDRIEEMENYDLSGFEVRLTELENAHNHNHTSEPEPEAEPEPDNHDDRIIQLEAQVLELQTQMSNILAMFSSD